jgi:hypothetical protein
MGDEEKKGYKRIRNQKIKDALLKKKNKNSNKEKNSL